MDIYSSTAALEYANQGRLEEWVHAFLLGEGNNVPFSEGLKLENRYYIGPLELPLDIFQRCCGPEIKMKYRINRIGFESRVEAILDRFQAGWDMPPLIVNYSGGMFELNDGNHRYEALIRNGEKKYYVIVWTTSISDYQDFNIIYGRSQI